SSAETVVPTAPSKPASGSAPAQTLTTMMMMTTSKVIATAAATAAAATTQLAGTVTKEAGSSSSVKPGSPKMAGAMTMQNKEVKKGAASSLTSGNNKVWLSVGAATLSAAAA